MIKIDTAEPEISYFIIPTADITEGITASSSGATNGRILLLHAH